VIDLDASYTHCQRCARDAHSNFYYCFYLLPRPKRLSMCALYAFLRRVDDIGDGGLRGFARSAAASQGADSVRIQRHELNRIRGSLSRSLAGQFDDPLFVALADTVRRYRIPADYLYAVIDGVEMDLDSRSYDTFADLQQYCRRVASVVGQACVHIWGFENCRAIELAEHCGLAFQLTNILRDLREDALGGRVYLPAEDLQRFGYGHEDLRRGVVDERFQALMRFEVERAERYYQSAAALSDYLRPDGRRIYYAMFRTYHQLLDKIRHQGGAVLSAPVRLAGWEKLRTAAAALFPLARGRRLPASSGAAVS